MENEILDSKLSKLKLDSKLNELKEKTGLIVQSILFPKKKYTLAQAKDWADDNGFKSTRAEDGDKFIHLQQKKSGRFNIFRTIIMGDNGIKARIAGNMTSKFAGSINLKGFSKFSTNIKSDMDLKIPLIAELQFLCEGSNKDGFIQREDLEASLDEWEDTPLIDWHDMKDMKNPTEHKISDRSGYLRNPRLEKIKDKWWIVADAEIINRTLAYHLYLKQKRNKPYQISPEYGWTPYYLNGKKYQTNIRPHLICIVDRGHLEGNKLNIKAS